MPTQANLTVVESEKFENYSMLKGTDKGTFTYVLEKQDSVEFLMRKSSLHQNQVINFDATYVYTDLFFVDR